MVDTIVIKHIARVKNGKNDNRHNIAGATNKAICISYRHQQLSLLADAMQCRADLHYFQACHSWSPQHSHSFTLRSASVEGLPHSQATSTDLADFGANLVNSID